MAGDGARFLPPEPGGPEPDLGPRDAGSDGRPAAPPQEPTHRGWAPPTAASGAPHHAPRPAYPPPAYPQSPSAPPPVGPGHPGTGAEPDNGSAVAGFVLSLVSGGLLITSMGLSTIVSLICGALGITYGRRGKKRVERGETTRQHNLAQAGFVIGIVSTVLSVLAIAFWTVVLVEAIRSGEFDRILDDYERDRDGGGRGEPAMLAAMVACRALTTAVL